MKAITELKMVNSNERERVLINKLSFYIRKIYIHLYEKKYISKRRFYRVQTLYY